MNFIDSDGKKYNRIFNEQNNTITISANYHTTESSMEHAKKAVSFWNSQSGKFKVNNYSVIFDLQVIQAENGNGISAEKMVGMNATSDTKGNLYEISNQSLLDKNLNYKSGVTIGGEKIIIYTPNATEYTGPHEVGHTLGLGHIENTIMSEASNRDRDSKITQTQVEEIVKSPVGENECTEEVIIK